MNQPKTKAALISSLLVVWGIFWMLVFMPTTHVDAQIAIWYTWVEDRTESVQSIEFIQSGDETTVVGQLYWPNKSTIKITNNPVILSGNTLSNDSVAGSNILWWAGNTLGSDNVTLIWWQWNIISSGNDNATVLWWVGNQISNTTSSNTPAVLAWWAGNVITNSDGAVILWWSGNVISWGTHSHILWWENNIVSVDNSLVAWSGVINQNAGNTFVFSNVWEFSPQTEWAFYINSIRGVGLGSDAYTEYVDGVSSAWWVKVWNIDIVANRCKAENLWVQWLANWCLVWCTLWSAADSGKWDLLEASETCIARCKWAGKNYCVAPIEPESRESYTWYCNTSNISHILPKLVQCNMWTISPSQYKDVVFEAELVDQCPNASDLGMVVNPCLYQCKDWATLEDGWCLASCSLPWAQNMKVKHWTIISAYGASEKTCPDSCNNTKWWFKCNDGAWKYHKWVLLLSAFLNHGVAECTQNGANSCPGDYTITENQKMPWCTYSTWCVDMIAVNGSCQTITKYKLIQCPGCTNPWDSTQNVSIGSSITGYKSDFVKCSE